ncbi:MAG TPA: thioredoxin family protein [Burkholderiaceae bacterium]|nr:thioredoxin family protein [Burkholderiaceae bacterium]
MFTQPRHALTALALTALLAACSKPAEVAAPAAPQAPVAAPADHADSGIAWKQASTDADVDAAFAQAKAQTKPVFVYWGAKWCPPCNQVKATLFNRRDFIERSRAFVPVYVDGDSPGAQKLGSRFKVSGYPTMLLFNPQGVEMTRLPGEVEAERYTQVLTLGMNAQRPVRDLLAQVKAGGAGLTANDWRLLAFYSWDTDQQQLVTKDGVPALMKQLADACPADQTEIATRLRLKALAAVDDKAPARPDAAAQATLLKVLADAASARPYMDVLTNYATDITRALSARGSPQRAELLAAFDAALKRFEADETLSRADRMTALIAQVDLATIDAPRGDGAKAAKPKLSDALLADIRAQTTRADREITDGYERQSVITAAAYLLERAGLGGESDALLQANLAKSHSPYYLMSELASNAKARGDKTEALRWYEQAFDKSEGPATRLQWGASYVSALVEMAPHDDARIEKAAAQLLTEAARQPDAFYERSGRALQRVGAKLQRWNKGGAHAATLKRLQAQLDGVCGALDASDPKRANCAGLFKPAPKQAA